MRILTCAAEAPLPPLNGFRLQLRAVSEQLARRHSVVMLAYRWPEQHGEAPDGIELRTLPLPSPSFGRRGARWAVASRPLGAVTATPPMAAATQELLAAREFDV